MMQLQMLVLPASLKLGSIVFLHNCSNRKSVLAASMERTCRRSEQGPEM